MTDEEFHALNSKIAENARRINTLDMQLGDKRDEITKLHQRLNVAEMKLAEYDNAFKWFEVAKDFFQKSMVAAFAARAGKK